MTGEEKKGSPGGVPWAKIQGTDGLIKIDATQSGEDVTLSPPFPFYHSKPTSSTLRPLGPERRLDSGDDRAPCCVATLKIVTLAMPFCHALAMPCHVPCHALPCLAMPCHACLPCLAMPCHALPAMPCHAALPWLCLAMLPCCQMPCHGRHGKAWRRHARHGRRARPSSRAIRRHWLRVWQKPCR